MKLRGIAFKTFMFTTALITLVVLISFGILYAVLPGYYIYLKNRALNKNADMLVSELIAAGDEQDTKAAIARFCANNSSVVTAFAEDGAVLPEFSYPLVMLAEGSDMGYSISVTYHSGDALLMREPMVAIRQELPPADVNRNVSFVLRQRLDAADILLTRSLSSGGIRGLEIRGTLQPINEAQAVVVSLIPYMLALAVLVSLAAAYFYSKRLTRPIIGISDTAAQMRQLIPGISSGVTSNDELGLLSQNLNSLYTSFCAALESLRREMNKVSRLEKFKTDFMRAASHELKTPLAALNGITEGMIDGVGVYADRSRYLNESKKQIDRLSALVEEILGASRLEYLNETIRITEVDISRVLTSAMEDYSYQISEKGLAVSYSPQSIIWRTDEKIIGAVLSNVISNAVSYTDDGGEICITAEPGGITVENECPAIPEDDLQRVFEPFFVRDYSRDRRRSGTGLGLFIVRKNLDALGIEHGLVNTERGVKFFLRMTDCENS